MDPLSWRRSRGKTCGRVREGETTVSKQCSINLPLLHNFGLARREVRSEGFSLLGSV